MDWIITVTIIFLVVQDLQGFNIEPVAWKSFTNAAAGFGYKVIQRPNGLLVSAPLERFTASEKGGIYECDSATATCRKILTTLPAFAVNASLGLTMAPDSSGRKSLVCGPTIPKDCKSITMYTGLCFEMDQNNRVAKTTPTSSEDCPSQPADIAFLLDGSGSVLWDDFKKMKTFVKNVVSSFLGKNAKFAIIQFSHVFQIHYYFNTFQVSGNWQLQIDNIRQVTGGTLTANAIQRVVDEVFTPEQGNRPNVNKVLIVITDGESQDHDNLRSSADAANRKNIVRFAIGVGRSFTQFKPLQELQTIASTKDNVFQVDGFDALDRIRGTLQEKIFSIEGSQTGGDSLKMEMSQLGFEAAFSNEGFQMTAVGANQWKGGFMKYTDSGVRTSTYEPMDIENDSYLGYSIAIAQTEYGTVTVVGAPRYQHRGIVKFVYSNYREQNIDPAAWEFQSGEYFGAEVCTMDVNRDSITDLILISAPMFIERDREGRVYVCDVVQLNVECHDSPVVLRGAPERGRFGSSLAVLPDLNSDNLNDLAVGAPLENGGQGSIYIFHGAGFGKINPTYSQRIAASEVKSGLKYFGLSISQTSLDQSNDGLPDLSVGSKGTVVLLRSKPIVRIETTVSFNPQQISTQNKNCSKPLDATATICFTMSKLSGMSKAQAKIHYTFTLDSTRTVPNNRAFIREKQREKTGSTIVGLNGPNCIDIKFFIQSCPDDALNPLYNELHYTFEGLPSGQNLPSPSLSQQSPTTINKDLGFEINCGTDNTCTDNLRVDFNFSKSTEVRVGIDELLNVTVSLENREEDSYNTRVLLSYPAGLSFRKSTSLQGRIDCNSLDSVNSLSRGTTECSIDKPIFSSRATALFVVSYGIDTNSQLERRIFVTANATSGNVQSSQSSQLYKYAAIDVKYSVFMTIGSSHSYTNFTYGNNKLQKPVSQTIKVTNEIRAVNFSVVLRVPVKLGEKDVWAGDLQIADCESIKDESPTDLGDFVSQIQQNKQVDCSVARCRVFRCTRSMRTRDSKDYIISANLSSAWIEQIGLKSAKFLLISTASLEYDKDRFVFYSAETNNNPPVRKIEAEVDVYTEVDYTKYIIAGCLGALALLLLLTFGLYKAGFFKSKYQQMIADDAAGGPGGPEEPEI